MNSFKLFLSILLACMIVAPALFTGQAQAQDMAPEETEVWEPVPEKVTPGKENEPPSDATVLFGGSDLSEWESTDGGAAEWEVNDSFFTVEPGAGNIQTKQEFGDVQLHIEWRSPAEVVGEGQGRGNSGIFLQSRYELQVLDSYNNRTYSNGMAGSIYKQHIPLVNPTRGPGEWQAYDIVFKAPDFNADGSVKSPARMTAFLNGVLIQYNAEIKGPTVYIGYPEYEAHGKAPLQLQDHGNPVSYRNIWIRPLDLDQRGE